MIGEQFDYGDEICGAVVSVRGKQEKVALWTKNAANETAQVYGSTVVLRLKQLKYLLLSTSLLLSQVIDIISLNGYAMKNCFMMMHVVSKIL